MERDFQTAKGEIYVRRLELPENYSKAMVSRGIVELLEEKLKIKPLHIAHTLKGKPFIAELPGMQLSISHAENLVAVYLSENQAVGIDIETKKSAIAKVKPYFINEKEQQSFKSFTPQELHLVWGAKEAVYKQYEGNFTELEKEVTVISIGSSAMLVESPFGRISCFYEMEKDVFLVWT